jgi:hypothetical protein
VAPYLLTVSFKWLLRQLHPVPNLTFTVAAHCSFNTPGPLHSCPSTQDGFPLENPIACEVTFIRPFPQCEPSHGCRKISHLFLYLLMYCIFPSWCECTAVSPANMPKAGTSCVASSSSPASHVANALEMFVEWLREENESPFYR